MTAITDDLLGHIGAGGVIIYLIEWMKRSQWRIFDWIGPERTKWAVWLSMLGAFITSIGFQWSWEGTWPSFVDLLQHGGTAHLTLVIPNMDTIVRALGQYILQRGAYHAAVKPNGSGS